MLEDPIHVFFTYPDAVVLDHVDEAIICVVLQADRHETVLDIAMGDCVTCVAHEVDQHVQHTMATQRQGGRLLRSRTTFQPETEMPLIRSASSTTSRGSTSSSASSARA